VERLFFGYMTETDKMEQIIRQGAEQAMSDKAFLELEISKWKMSKERVEQIAGEKYYEGYHDILWKKRMAIGKGGELEEITNVPNRKDVDNQYAAAVDKKANYFLGKPFTIQCENDAYVNILTQIFNRKFMKKLKNMAKKSLNGGKAWMLPYYDERGEFKFKVFPAHQILPFWKDAEHEELEFAIRLYPVLAYEGTTQKIIEKVEVYKPEGVYRYVFDNSHLVVDVEAGEFSPYLLVNNVPYRWDRIPLICFKYNDNEIPLIRRVKSLQDGINELLSMFHNNMLEDNRTTILVIHNYDGQDLGEFRHNLAQYGAVKVRSVDGTNGGVDSLTVEVNSENYNAILTLLKDKLIENAKSFDGKLLSSGTPNQMNILSMYQDIDIDTNEFESEYQSAMEELLYFVNSHLSATGKGDFTNEEVDFVFNRDMLMNESEIMQTLISAGVEIPNKLLLAQVPWIDDVDEAEKLLKEQKEAMVDDYQNAFGQQQSDPVKENGDDE